MTIDRAAAVVTESASVTVPLSDTFATMSQVSSDPVRSVTLEGVGHYATLEAPDQVAHALLDFFSIVDATGTSGSLPDHSTEASKPQRTNGLSAQVIGRSVNALWPPTVAATMDESCRSGPLGRFLA